MSQEWYFSQNGQQQGPVSSEQLKQLATSGQLGRADLIWKDGMDQWAEARSVNGLFPKELAPPPPPLPTGNRAKGLGVNLNRVNCPQCGTEQPRIRLPGSVQEMMWGGTTCKNCGCQMDKYGKQVAAAPNGGNSPPVSEKGTPLHCRHCGKEVSQRAVACVACGMRPQDGNQFCPSCAAPTQPAQVVCVKCGVGLKGGAGGNRIAASVPPKDPMVMGLLSGLCIAGLGQMILGQVAKGAAILLSSMVLAVFTVGISIFVTWPLGGIDAYLIAKKLKEGKTVGQWEFF